MKKSHPMMLVIVVAVALLAYSAVALAAAAPAPAPAAAKPAPAPAAAKPAVAAPAAKPAPPAGVPAVVTGKIETKMEKNKKGNEVKRCLITVSAAKGADGKAIDALKGKVLHVVGKNVAEVEKFAGKDAEITGAIVENKRIRAESVK